MIARKVRLVVLRCEVCHLLPKACLYNGSLNSSFIYTFFCEESLDIFRLDSTNGPARPPPNVPRTGGAQLDAASARRSRVERSSPAYRATQVPLFPSPERRSEISPWHKASGRKSSTLPALARHAQGHSLGPSLEEAAQSICGSHDSSSIDSQSA